MTTKKLFIASTGQNVGKTTLSLGIAELLKMRFSGFAFMKPVGQESIFTSEKIQVDKDVVLMQKHFKLALNLSLMSPILIPSGFTKDFLDEKISSESLKNKVKRAYLELIKNAEAIVIEGTGHLGVGSIVDLNNAQVAALLEAPILLICPGGLGSSFDELSLNIALCEKYNAKIAGVVVNKVKPEKIEMVSNYMQKALRKYKLPLLGCLPYDSLLSSPTLHDLEMLFEEQLITGKNLALKHFETIRVLAGSANRFEGFINGSQLLITSASREDLLLAILTKYWDNQIHREDHVEVSIILTGETPPKPSIIEKLKAAGIPMLYIPKTTQAVVKTIHNFQSKIQQEDTAKIKEAIHIVKSNLDINALIKVMG